MTVDEYLNNPEGDANRTKAIMKGCIIKAMRDAGIAEEQVVDVVESLDNICDTLTIDEAHSIKNDL